jgi:translation initiation factor IF-2
VGNVNSSDVRRAGTTSASIVAFNAKCPPLVAQEAFEVNVDVMEHNVIYELLDDVKAHMSKFLPDEFEDEVRGEATVLKVFSLNGKKRGQGPSVAGCKVTSGVMHRGQQFRVLRDGKELHVCDGASSIRHFKVGVAHDSSLPLTTA